jgi:hypothetical protein
MTVPFGLHRARVGRDHTRSVLNGKQITAVLPAYNAGVVKTAGSPATSIWRNSTDPVPSDPRA